MKLKLGFITSHNGTGMKAIVEAIETGNIEAKPCVFISNNSATPALTYAAEHSIPTLHISNKTSSDSDGAIKNALIRHKANLVILSGYLKKIGPLTLACFRGRILNSHPALLPKHGGRGMYGDRVYKAVLKAKDEFTGPTIHIVDDEYDHGLILAQSRIKIEPTDNVETLTRKVQEVEKVLYIKVLKDISSGKIKLSN